MAHNETLSIQLQLPDGSWQEVGYLHSVQDQNWFEFTDSYWDLPSRGVLGQVFEDRGRLWRPTARVALPPWFSHLLPEGRLRRAVADTARIEKKHEFELLKKLGDTDLPGAVRCLPVDSHGDSIIPEALTDHDETDINPVLKFSLAGVQLKFSIYSSGRGATVPAKGQAGNCILKFPDGRPDFSGVPEAELGCLELASASGIDAAKAKLVSPSDVTGLEGWAEKAVGMALAVKRFDRDERSDMRIHMEELAQVMNIGTGVADAKYKRANFELISTYISFLAGVEHIGEVIDRIVLNILVGNGDAHLKNWAFTYPDGVKPKLSPMYDVLPTVLYLPEDNLGLNLDKSKVFETVTSRNFERIGTRSGYGPQQAGARAREATARISR